MNNIDDVCNLGSFVHHPWDDDERNVHDYIKNKSEPSQKSLIEIIKSILKDEKDRTYTEDTSVYVDYTYEYLDEYNTDYENDDFEPSESDEEEEEDVFIYDQHKLNFIYS